MLVGAGRKTRVHRERGCSPLFFYQEDTHLSELSIFIDESGDFGEYDDHSPYYIIAMVFHDQSNDISDPINKLEIDLTNRGLPNHCVHTGPIIRRENEYEFMSIDERRRILNSMVTFIKHCGLKYRCVHIEKKHIEDSVAATLRVQGQTHCTRQGNRGLIIHITVIIPHDRNADIFRLYLILLLFAVASFSCSRRACLFAQQLK
ncbi:MAG: DUF3800 domain-containing protein [Clostridia bacterium]|nr:DUF3800 domain-containing protein [Clostridia bacterium]